MKLTSLFVVSSLAIAGVVGAIATDAEMKTAEYSPRDKSASGSFLNAIPYLKMLRGNLETGEYELSDGTDMAQAVNEFDRNHSGQRAADLSWWEMGPNNIGGRTRAICAVTNDLIFVGSVSGGLYKSTDAGNTWTRVESLDAFGKTMAISCMDQTGDGSLYVGTGSKFESNFGGDGGSAALGVGLYRSADLGVSWTLVPGTEPSPFSNTENWAYINDICADPTNPNRIWITGDEGSGYYDASNGDLNMDLNGIPTGSGHDIEWANNGSYVLVGVSNGRVYKSTDGGNNFSQIGNSQLSSKQRVRIAISPDDVNIIYVLYAQSGFMGGLYYSADAGNTWELKWPTGQDDIFSVFGQNGQAFYDLALTVKPGDPGVCWIGGVTLWQGGANTQPEQIAFNFDFGSSELYVHSDVHTFEIAPNGDWYIGGDGGVFKSVNGGQSFVAMNRGFVTTQLYGIGHGGGYPVIGGTQDNGTFLIAGMESGIFETDSWQQGTPVQGGDGFRCDLSNVTYPGVAVAFATSQYGALGRYNAQGSGGGFYDDEINDLIGTDGEIGPFYSIIRLFENTEDTDSQQEVILFNNRNEDLFSSEEDGVITWLDTTLFTQNLTLPFNYRFPLGDTLHFWPTLVRPEIWSTELLTEDPNYPWLEVQDLTSQVDSTITTEILIGFETVIDQIIEETVWIFWEDSVFVPEIEDYYVFNDSAEIVIGVDTTFIEQPIYQYSTVTTNWYYYASDVLENVREQWRIQDMFTSMMVTGFNGSDGVWITRQALNFNVSPDWWKIGNAPSSGIRAFEFTRDGKTLFYSSWGGQLFRVSNLDQLWSAEDVSNLQISTIVSNAGGAITSIASDPNNFDHLVYTVGGYGTINAGKVRESSNAMAGIPTFSNIWEFTGDEVVLERMPVFASVIDVMDESGNTIVVGTEFGIWASDDGGGTWTHNSNESAGIPNYPQAGPSMGSLVYTPVFDLRQQQVGIKPYMDPENYGTIYAGTHGRGIWRSDDFLSVGVPEVDELSGDLANLLIYPNPTMGEAFVSVQLNSAVNNADIRIFTVNGQLARHIRTGQLSVGTHRISLESEALAAGNYVVQLTAGSASGTGKLIKR